MWRSTGEKLVSLKAIVLLPTGPEKTRSSDPEALNRLRDIESVTKIIAPLLLGFIAQNDARTNEKNITIVVIFTSYSRIVVKIADKALRAVVRGGIYCGIEIADKVHLGCRKPDQRTRASLQMKVLHLVLSETIKRNDLLAT